MADMPPEGAGVSQRGLLSPLLVATLSIVVFAAGMLFAGHFPATHVAATSKEPPIKSVELVRLIEQVKTGLFEADLAARRNNQMTVARPITGQLRRRASQPFVDTFPFEDKARLNRRAEETKARQKLDTINRSYGQYRL